MSTRLWGAIIRAPSPIAHQHVFRCTTRCIHRVITMPMMAAADAAPTPPPAPSARIAATDHPCIVATKALVASVPGTLSLAQGKKPPIRCFKRLP